MGRRRKQLVDVVRDGTFLARKDELLLNGRDPLPWPDLDDYRRRFRAAGEHGRRDVALELERELRDPEGPARVLGDLQQAMRRLGPPDSVEQLLAFAPWAFRHRAGELAGRPYHFPPNHEAFLREFWRRDRHGRRIYTVGVLMEPKGCSKTPSMTILGVHTLATFTDAPEVSQISGVKRQANFGHKFARENIETGVLGAWMSAGGHTIECPEYGGEHAIWSAEGDFSAGANTATGLFDELFLFVTRNQREAWVSQVEALHKRQGRSYVLGCSTTGWRKDTLLGEIYDRALAHPRLEEIDEGFHLRLRDEEAGLLFWYHGIPVDADIEDPDVVRRATPAPWVDPSFLIRSLKRGDTDELDWRRLHGNQWTSRELPFLPSGIWAGLDGSTQIPEAAPIVAGLRTSPDFDTTAIAWAWIGPDGRKVIRARVWSTRPQTLPHVHIDRAELDNEALVLPFLAELGFRYRVVAVALDEKYFAVEAAQLRAAGTPTVKAPPQGSVMSMAAVQFERDAKAGALEHDGDRVLAAHVGALGAVIVPETGEKRLDLTPGGDPAEAGTAAMLANLLTVVKLPAPPVPEPFGGAW